jgi:xanthine dehydrogenase accessory factor
LEPNIWKSGLELTQKAVPFCQCTVIESTGSVPRRSGSSMIVRGDGSTVGTIGGGTLERLATEEARRAIADGQSRSRTFDLNDPAGHDTGAVCGGTVTVFFNVQRPARVAHLFGAGHVALPTARLLASVGYAVKLYDGSSKHANAERFPDVAEIFVGDLAELAKTADVRPDDSVVILTASHETDFQIVRAFKDRLPFYLGVIGSKAKAAHYRKLLAEEGWPESEIARIHSPIGLEIGSRTPEEIAVSIVAEMISLRGPSE